MTIPLTPHTDPVVPGQPAPEESIRRPGAKVTPIPWTLLHALPLVGSDAFAVSAALVHLLRENTSKRFDPTLRDIARFTGISLPRVKRAFARLEKHGVMKTTATA